MDFITRNSKDLDELVGVVVDIFEKNTYIQKKDANSLWIIGEIQKQFMTSTRLYSDFMTIPKDERPAVFYDILFFILAHRSIRQLIPDAQQEEIQMIIDNKSCLRCSCGRSTRIRMGSSPQTNGNAGVSRGSGHFSRGHRIGLA